MILNQLFSVKDNRFVFRVYFVKIQASDCKIIGITLNFSRKDISSNIFKLPENISCKYIQASYESHRCTVMAI